MVESTKTNTGKNLPIEFDILELFNTATSLTLGPSDVERLLGKDVINKGSASRAMKRLAEGGYLDIVGQGRYVLGGKLAIFWSRNLGKLSRQVETAQILMRESLMPVAEMLKGLQGLAGQEAQHGGS